jgi:hypothetical protein
MTGYYDTIYPPTSNVYYVSVAAVDEHQLESLFSKELIIQNSQISVDEIADEELKPLDLLQNRPNPFDEVTIIGVAVNTPIAYKNAFIQITDLNGKLVEQLNIDLNLGINEVFYQHGYGKTGIYYYSLMLDGKEIARKPMIFAN